MTRARTHGLCVVHRLWDGCERRESIETDRGDWALPVGRSLILEPTGRTEVTSTVRVEAHNGDVEIRVLERGVQVGEVVVRDGETHEVHIWPGHSVEVEEARRGD